MLLELLTVMQTGYMITPSKQIRFSMEENKMKNWNAAEIVELNITETANGIFPALFESCLTDNILDCGKGPETNENENNKGENNTPDTLS